jgi:hypothetical protein
VSMKLGKGAKIHAIREYQIKLLSMQVESIEWERRDVGMIQDRKVEKTEGGELFSICFHHSQDSDRLILCLNFSATSFYSILSAWYASKHLLSLLQYLEILLHLSLIIL